MIRTAALILSFLVAGPATAQTDINVRVRPTEDVPATKCGAGDYLRLELLGVAAHCQARAAAAARKDVGDLIATGRCPEAVQAALRLGDLQYAREVRDFCSVPAQKPPN